MLQEYLMKYELLTFNKITNLRNYVWFLEHMQNTSA